MKETSGINDVAAFPTINFKTMLYLLVSIAVLFIAIIPVRIISGIFSQDVSIFYISFAGFTVLLEFMVWCFLCVPMKIYESILANKAMDEKLIVAEEQPGSKLPNEEVVSGEPEMLLAMKEETKDIITPSSMIDLYRQGCDDFTGIKRLIGKSSLTRSWNIFIIPWLRLSNRMTWRHSVLK